MELVKPEIGLIFWMTVTFLVVLFLLRKFAWKPILKMLNDRDAKIENSLQEAERARKEVENLKSENENLLAQARAERDKILKEAKEIREKLITEAKTEAQNEGRRMIQSAKESIEKEKQLAMRELREQTVNIAMEAASKILRKELDNKGAQ